MKDCNLCGLGKINRDKNQEHCIMGTGNSKTGIMFVGDFISQQDAIFGNTFSGGVGSLLNECIEKSGYKRDDVYTTNVVHCNPVGNKNPKPNIIAACKIILDKEIEIIKPKIIVPLGAIATKFFLGNIKISDVRGYVFKKKDYVVLPTFSPKAALTVPKSLYPMQADIKKAFRVLEGKEVQISTKYLDLLSIPDHIPEEQYKRYEKEQIEKAYNLLKKADEWSFDIETTSLDPFDKSQEIISCSFSFKEGVAICIPFDLEWYKKIFSLSAKKITHTKFDCKFLRVRYDIEVINWYFDTYVAIGILNENVSYGLKFLASIYTDVPYYNLPTKISMQTTNKVLVAKYNNVDADVTYRLYKLFYKRIIDDNFYKLFFETMMPVSKMVIDLECEGMLVDIDKLKLLNINKNLDLVRIRKKLLKYADINWKSTAQVGKVLYEQLGLMCPKKTPTGRYSTDEKALESLKDKHEVPGLLHESRSLVKSLGTYLLKEIDFGIKIPDKVSDSNISEYTLSSTEVKLLEILKDRKLYKPDYSNDLFSLLQRDNKIHNENNINGTVSGRLSSPLHTIPKEGGFRGCYIVSKYYKFVSMDIKQFELRITAYLAGDNKLMKILDSFDAKQQLTKMIAGKEYSEKTWTHVKSIIYGTLYGMGVNRMSNELNISYTLAEKLKDNFYRVFPKVKSLLDGFAKYALNYGHIVDNVGRTRRFITSQYKIYDNEHDIRNQAVNFPIQSFGSAIFWDKVLLIHDFLKDKKSKIIHSKHDAIYMKIHNTEMDLIDKCKEILETNTLIGDVLIDVKIGDNWGEC